MWLIFILIYLFDIFIIFIYCYYYVLNRFTRLIQIFPNKTFEGNSYVCYNISDSIIPPPKSSWQTIAHNYGYIYSAFIDNREGNMTFIKSFIAINHSLRNSVKFHCQIWYRNQSHPRGVDTTIISRHHKDTW